MAKVEIKSNGVVTHILVDGVEIKDVTYYSLAQDAGELPNVCIFVKPTELVIDTLDCEYHKMEDLFLED
jgi:hypothetical protein